METGTPGPSIPTTTEASRRLRSSGSQLQQNTPGTRSYKRVSDRSRAAYSVYLVKDKTSQVMAVLIETKMTSSATFEHAVAQVSE